MSRTAVPRHSQLVATSSRCNYECVPWQCCVSHVGWLALLVPVGAGGAPVECSEEGLCLRLLRLLLLLLLLLLLAPCPSLSLLPPLPQLQ